jgi:hypothetical protein
VLVFTRFWSLPLLAALLLTGFAFQLTLGLSFTYIREVVDSRVAATAVAFQTSIGFFYRNVREFPRVRGEEVKW